MSRHRSRLTHRGAEPLDQHALEPDAPNGDVAVLRRYLVDHGLLRRTASGSEHVRTHE
nr:DUF2087 domain-containing protein [Microbacterium sp. SCN 69-37]